MKDGNNLPYYQSSLFNTNVVLFHWQRHLLNKYKMMGSTSSKKSWQKFLTMKWHKDFTFIGTKWHPLTAVPIDGSVIQRYDSPPPHLLGCELIFTLESIVVFFLKYDEVFKCGLFPLPDLCGLAVNNLNTENLVLVLRHVAAAAACWPAVLSEETGIHKQLINVSWLIARVRKVGKQETGSWCLDSMPANYIYKNLKNKQMITGRTRFQLKLPVPNQKSPNFEMVIKWWKTF